MARKHEKLSRCQRALLHALSGWPSSKERCLRHCAGHGSSAKTGPLAVGIAAGKTRGHYFLQQNPRCGDSPDLEVKQLIGAHRSRSSAGCHARTSGRLSQLCHNYFERRTKGQGLGLDIAAVADCFLKDRAASMQKRQHGIRLKRSSGRNLGPKKA